MRPLRNWIDGELVGWKGAAEATRRAAPRNSDREERRQADNRCDEAHDIASHDRHEAAGHDDGGDNAGEDCGDDDERYIRNDRLKEQRHRFHVGGAETGHRSQQHKRGESTQAARVSLGEQLGDRQAIEALSARPGSRRR
jgi:hypothetical protein